MTHQDIRSYFEAEKSATFVFIIIGAIAIIAGIVFFFLKSKVCFGAAFPLIIIGILELAVGYSVHSRTDKQVSDVVYSFDMNPDYLKEKELPRMEKVTSNFTAYKLIEVILVIIGIVLFWLNYQKQNVWLGVGIAILIQALVMLIGDQFAHKRAQKYTAQLREFVQKSFK